MAKPNAADEPAGMERADIKRHLRFAKDEPVSVAFALGGDGKAIMQFDRRKPGRALEKQLKDAAPDSKSHRWGTALVDPNDDKTVCFTVNKAGGGLARKLIVALKGTGFNKVKIQLDDGTEVEAHEEADTEGTEGDEAKPAAAPAAAAATPAEPSPAAANQPNPAALAKDLTDLVKRMLAVIAKDPTQKAALAELATDAQASLKRGDLDQASAGIDILREAVKDGEAASAGRGGGAAQVSMPNGAGPAPAAANGKAAPAANGKAAPADGQPDLRQEGEQILALLAETVKKAMAMVSQIPGLGEIVKSVVPAVQAAIKSGQLELAMSGVQRLADAIVGGSGGAAGGAGSGDKSSSRARRQAGPRHRQGGQRLDRDAAKGDVRGAEAREGVRHRPGRPRSVGRSDQDHAHQGRWHAAPSRRPADARAGSGQQIARPRRTRQAHRTRAQAGPALPEACERGSNDQDVGQQSVPSADDRQDGDVQPRRAAEEHPLTRATRPRPFANPRSRSCHD